VYKSRLTQDEYNNIKGQIIDDFLNQKQIAIVTRRSEQIVRQVKNTTNFDEYRERYQTTKNIKAKEAAIIGVANRDNEPALSYYTILDQLDAIRNDMDQIKNQIEAISYLITK
jgi:hypothetical protein